MQPFDPRSSLISRVSRSETAWGSRSRPHQSRKYSPTSGIVREMTSGIVIASGTVTSPPACCFDPKSPISILLRLLLLSRRILPSVFRIHRLAAPFLFTLTQAVLLLGVLAAILSLSELGVVRLVRRRYRHGAPIGDYVSSRTADTIARDGAPHASSATARMDRGAGD